MDESELGFMIPNIVHHLKLYTTTIETTSNYSFNENNEKCRWKLWFWGVKDTPFIKKEIFLISWLIKKKLYGDEFHMSESRKVINLRENYIDILY